jgi:microcystin-dependent protein
LESTGDLLTVTRAQEGTSAQAFTNTTTRVELRNTKGTLERMVQRSGDTLTGDLDVGGFSLLNAVLPDDADIDPRAIFPVGLISLWSGSVGSIPQYWQLCNGTNGTPDLRDRFVIGAGSSYAVNATGGATSATGTSSSNGAHDHGAATGSHVLTTAEIPAHVHRAYVQAQGGAGDTESIQYNNAALAGNTDGTKAYLSENGSGVDLIEAAGSGGGHDHTLSSDGAHTHTTTVSIMPPYYALAYIMFTGT